MPGDSSVCVGGVWVIKVKETNLLFIFFLKERNHVDSRFAAVLGELVVFLTLITLSGM